MRRKALFILPLLLLCSLSDAGAAPERPKIPDFAITSIQVSKAQAVVSVTNLSGMCGGRITVVVKLALQSAVSGIKDYSLSKTIPCSTSVVPVAFTLKHEHSMGSGSCDVCSGLEATVDPQNLVSETNENNNVRWQNIN